MANPLVIGVDYGSDSARAILIDALAGTVLSSSSCAYPRWMAGKFSDISTSRYRQHPLDYIEVLHKVLAGVLSDESLRSRVVAIGVDTTASTPCLTDADSTPLALLPEFAEDPDAMFVLWKDHTAMKEAAEISDKCAHSATDYSSRSGFTYSAENCWSKVLHILRTNPRVASAACSLIELADYVPSVLVGHRVPSSHCVASSKMMYSTEWGGYPPAEFFAALGGEKIGKIRDSLSDIALGSSRCAGIISADWAQELGLSQDVRISVGNIDAHSGAVGAGCSPGNLAMTLGTSACMMAVMPDYRGPVLKGVFGQVTGSIIDGMEGFEMGMSAFGDVYAWFKRLLSETLCGILSDRLSDEELNAACDRILPVLGEQAEKLDGGSVRAFATDWINGRRTPGPDSSLTGTIGGIRMTTGAAEIYYNLVEATAFAVRAIVEHLEKGGVVVDKLTAIGGIAVKSPFVVQMIADVLGRKVCVPEVKEACAYGAAINATVAAGIYPDVVASQASLCRFKEKVYVPRDGRCHEERWKVYSKFPL